MGLMLLIYLILKQKITGQTGNNGIKEIEIMAPLKYLSNFWKTLEMPLVNCEINLILNCSTNYIIVYTTWSKSKCNYSK